MVSVYIIVEGKTEVMFVKELLAPALSAHNLAIYASIIGKPGHKGGIRPYQSAKKDILNFLKQRQDTTVTLLIDYFGLPLSWPGVTEAKGKPPGQIPKIIESALDADIQKEFDSSFNPKRFIPYVQMHEFEALLFSDPAEMASQLGQPELKEPFEAIRSQFGTPEEINDSPQTSPSHRISHLCPTYEKPLYGAVIAVAIGLAKMRVACPHFHAWLGKLEALTAHF